MIALGIDPGTALTGYGLVEERNNEFHHLTSGTIKTDKNLSNSKRLLLLHQNLEHIIATHSPAIIAVEKLFFFKNLKTALPVSEARGVILLTAEKTQKPLYEFTPLEVKQTVTGYGQADKNQVQEMIKTLLSLEKKPRPDDVADALGVAICAIIKHKSYH